MPRNGAGTASLAEAPFVFDTVISETAVNSDLSDIANMITASIANDGQTPILANLPMSSYKHTGVTATSGASSRTEYQSTATAQDGTVLDAGYTAGTDTAFTATLTPAIAAYADKQCFRVIFNAATGATPTINFNAVGAKKLYRSSGGSAVQITTNDIPANFPAILRYDSTLDSSAGAFWVLNSTPFTGGTLTSTLVMSGAAINEAKGSDIASATTTDIGAATGNYVDVTGTTTITGLGTVQAGTERVVQFDGILTLTHNGTSLILPGGANITTAAGDVATFRSEGSGNWRCTVYTRANGTPIVGGSGRWNLINTYALTGGSQAVTGFNSTLYSDYRIVLENVLMATNNAVLYLRTSTNGGSSYDAGGSDYDYQSSRPVAGVAGTEQSAAAAQLVISYQQVNTIALTGEVMIINPGAAAPCGILWQLRGRDGGSNMWAMIGGGSRVAAADVDAVQFLPNSGNFTSGTIRFYGLTK